MAEPKTYPIAERLSKIDVTKFAKPPDGATFFLESLPQVFQAKELLELADRFAGLLSLERKGRLFMLGGHVIKTGLTPLLVWLMDQGLVDFLACNAAVAIHDYELGRFGGTSENVRDGIADGSFGMAEETGFEINEAISKGVDRGWGMGQALGEELIRRTDLASPESSLLLEATKRGIPVTVHPAIGAEIIYQHPSANGAAIGQAGLADFHRLSTALPGMDTVLNVASAVIMPEVFLKALSLARNLNRGSPSGFLAIDFDERRSYRAWKNVCSRPTSDGHHITGRIEITFPLFVWAVADALSRKE